MFSSTITYSNELAEKESKLLGGWSSLDQVFFRQDENLMVKKIGTGPIKIGFTVKEVQEVMGIPDKIDQKEYIFYYHHSAIYFGEDWRVKSWDNRYGNLKVLPEREEIKLGYHISKVFQEKGFPLSIKKIGESYELDYVEELIYLNQRWLVEAIQAKEDPKKEKNKSVINW